MTDMTCTVASPSVIPLRRPMLGFVVLSALTTTLILLNIGIGAIIWKIRIPRAIAAVLGGLNLTVVMTDKVSPPLFSVAEFVALGRYPHTDFLGRLGPADHRAVGQALAAVHAEELARRPFSDLSDGERQKALVARALAQQPRLLLLDEPTIHLDLKHRMEVITILRDLCQTRGITVVASLHDIDR